MHEFHKRLVACLILSLQPISHSCIWQFLIFFVFHVSLTHLFLPCKQNCCYRYLKSNHRHQFIQNRDFPNQTSKLTQDLSALDKHAKSVLLLGIRILYLSHIRHLYMCNVCCWRVYTSKLHITNPHFIVISLMSKFEK